MSATTHVSGVIESTMENQENGYFGLNIEGEEDRLHGEGNLPDELEKGLEIELEVNDDGSFIDIQDWSLVHEKVSVDDGEGSAPVEVVRAGSFRIKVWRQSTGDGDTYYTFTQERSYTVDDGDSWEQTGTARERDLSDLAAGYSYLAQEYGLSVEKNNGGGQ